MGLMSSGSCMKAPTHLMCGTTKMQIGSSAAEEPREWGAGWRNHQVNEGQDNRGRGVDNSGSGNN